MEKDAETPIPWGRVVVIYAMMFGDALSMMFIFPIAPFIVRHQLQMKGEHTSIALYSGLLAGMYNLGQCLCSPFFGHLSDSLGRRPVLLCSLGVSTIFLLCFGLAPTYQFSLGLRFLQGATAAGWTVGKLYLSDVTDASNEARVFSWLGLFVGTGTFMAPVIGGILSEPDRLFPGIMQSDTALGALLRAQPFILPCACVAFFCFVNFLLALSLLPESVAPKVHIVGLDGKPISAAVDPPPATKSLCKSSASHALAKSTHSLGSRFSSGAPSPPPQGAAPPFPSRRRSTFSTFSASFSHDGRMSLGSDALLEASLVSLRRPDPLIEADEDLLGSTPRPPQRPAPASVVLMRRLADGTSTKASHALRSFRLPFWLMQVAVILFTITVNGFSEVLPVWLSSPNSLAGFDFGPGKIGNLQSLTGIVVIPLSLCVTYRVINACGPTRTMELGLSANTLASLLPIFADQSVEQVRQAHAYSLAVVLLIYALGAVSRNFVFPSALLLSKEFAPDEHKGLAIGINQSVNSFGGAIGPLFAGAAYSRALRIETDVWILRTGHLFFLAIGLIAGAAILAPACATSRHMTAQPQLV